MEIGRSDWPECLMCIRLDLMALVTEGWNSQLITGFQCLGLQIIGVTLLIIGAAARKSWWLTVPRHSPQPF